MTTGTVAELWRFPVKSMAGERLTALAVDSRGAAGDRTHALWWTIGGKYRTVSAHHHGGLLGWSATYPGGNGAKLDPDDPPPAIVTAPSGELFPWDAHELPDQLRRELGRDVDLRREPRGQQDVAGTLHVTTEASRAALSAELDRDLEVQRFRSNIHLTLDAEPYAEAAWPVGTELRFDGGVVLTVLEPCDRCSVPTRDPITLEADGNVLRTINNEHDTYFGVRCTVTTPGALSAGESLTVT